MSRQERKYRLFFMLSSPENISFAARNRFTRITPEYILVYTQKARMKPPVGGVIEISSREDLFRLTATDREWVLDCARSVMYEDLMKSKAEAFYDLSQMVDRLEEELEAEAAGGRGETA